MLTWMKTVAKGSLKRFGYQIQRLPQHPPLPDSKKMPAVAVPAGYDPAKGYVLYKYCKPDGSFDLDEYRRIQAEGNKRKIEMVWVIEDNIKFLSEYLSQQLGSPKFGLCHGTRRGMEQAWFRKYLPGCEVQGTEISDTATQFPNTIQWDFHEVKTEWLGAVDFIYSNSFDHSYDPEKCLNAWMSCLKPNGICILEHGTLSGQARANQLDPFGAELVQMPYLIATWGKGQFYVREILPAPIKKGSGSVRKGTNKNLDYLIVRKLDAR